MGSAYLHLCVHANLNKWQWPVVLSLNGKSIQSMNKLDMLRIVNGEGSKMFIIAECLCRWDVILFSKLIRTWK